MKEYPSLCLRIVVDHSDRATYKCPVSQLHHISRNIPKPNFVRDLLGLEGPQSIVLRVRDGRDVTTDGVTGNVSGGER